MTEPPPITLVIHDLDAQGGQERATYELVRRLLEHGAKVTVIARSCALPPSDQLRWVRIRGPRRPVFLALPWFFLLGSIATALYARGFRQAAGAIVFNRMDAITVHFCHLAYSRRATGARRSRASLMYGISAYLSSALSRLAERLCYRPSRARALVAVSEGVAGELRRFFPRMDVTVIPNGVDRAEFRRDPLARSRLRSALGLEEDDLAAAFVGGDWERKGLPIALEGLARTGRWHLLVGGGGGARAIRELARRENALGRLHLFRAGEIIATSDLLSAADALLFPTSYEGFSLVTLEAAAMGLPLLISRVNGSQELVTDGETGFFIDRTPESVERALEALAEDPERRRRMGERAREVSASYDWDRVARLYEALYAGDIETAGA